MPFACEVWGLDLFLLSSVGNALIKAVDNKKALIKKLQNMHVKGTYKFLHSPSWNKPIIYTNKTES